MLFLEENLDFLVFGILGLMSFIMLWLVVERYVYYARICLHQFTHEQTLQIALTNHLTFIATVGSNAPYVGLLGTVLGIMLTFYQMGQGNGINIQAIMTGLALALKATAAGLFVALPAIVFYNMLLRKVDVLMAQWKALQDQKLYPDPNDQEA
ncbi:MAG TPA: TonB-system energizer ExbB [Thiothrix sp.]|nr:TonB-system energizer ExbB [Thiothrix sp.]